MKNHIQNAISTVGLSINRNSPSILIGLGLSGLVGSIFLAVKATPRAIEILEGEAYRQFKDHGGPEDLDIKTKIELVWPVYLPTASTATMAIFAVLLGNKIHLRRAAALASIYTITENALKSYQEKVLEVVGKNKAAQIQGEVEEEELKNNPPTEENTHNVGGGRELCYETLTGRYFWSDAEKIRAAVNVFNHDLLTENVKTLNEFFYDIGLPQVEIAEKLGWDVSEELMEIFINARVSDANEKPCLVIHYVTRPQYLWK